eukprot:CAMPEP_0194742754 /NCGR_PEP_ID=MMETSP0296-20130528/99933_1 /TAXON_ID=39354 /ORGANISM="Heterosigma akashiwo, Strain CCMP2393" /LENGTH=99 /DNA_ID=CAMNT_0039654715 /DNA_START=682 /DNA_END=981 /DNA_ORIENTATION=+
MPLPGMPSVFRPSKGYWYPWHVKRVIIGEVEIALPSNELVSFQGCTMKYLADGGAACLFGLEKHYALAWNAISVPAFQRIQKSLGNFIVFIGFNYLLCH